VSLRSISHLLTLCGIVQVKALLFKAEDIDAIIQAVPELSDPVALSRSLAFLASSFPNKDPVLLLQENPQILLNLAESNMEDHAEVGGASRGVLRGCV